MQKKLPSINSTHGTETRNIINEIIKAINDRGLEILSESGFLTWLEKNGIKHREEVQTFSDLPSSDSLNTVRGVADDNKIYIKKENGWVAFQTIDINKINKIETELKSRHITFEDFGAVGDGDTDDTSALQEAINYAASSGKKIISASGRNYKVSKRGSVNYNVGSGNNTSDYAVIIPDDVDVDFNDSTISNLDSDYCSLLINEGLFNVPVTINKNISITNLKVKGNIDVDYKTTTYSPAINLVGVDNLKLENITGDSLINSGIRVLKSKGAYINKITMKKMWGNGLYLGITKDDVEDTRLHNAKIDDIYIEETYETPTGVSSNSVIACLVDSNIGTIQSVNCSWGVKLQNDSENVNIDTINTRGGNLSTLNSGLRLQGLSDSRPARNINVSNVISVDCEGSGLYIQFGDRININNYIGEGNGRGGYTDVWIHRRNISINNISISNAYSSGISLRAGSSDITLGSVIASNVNGTVISDSSLNSVIDKLVISNTNPAFNTERAIVTLTSSTNTIIDKLYNRTDRIILFGLISHLPKVNELYYDSALSPHDFEIPLSNGETRTDIMNNDIVYMNNGAGLFQKTNVEITQIKGRPLAITNRTHINGGFRIEHDSAIGDEVLKIKIGAFKI